MAYFVLPNHKISGLHFTESIVVFKTKYQIVFLDVAATNLHFQTVANDGKRIGAEIFFERIGRYRLKSARTGRGQGTAFDLAKRFV
jgi:hypothetical protein